MKLEGREAIIAGRGSGIGRSILPGSRAARDPLVREDKLV